MMCDPANPRGNGIVNIWQESFPVRFGAIDRSDRMTLDAIFQVFQEAAISHAVNLGVGREEMANAGQVWILSRMSVLVDRRPDYCETVTLKSWPRGSEKLFAMRNYEILDKNDIPVVRARSAWIIVDIQKRRPIRPQSLSFCNLPLNEGLDALPPEAGGTAALIERDNLSKVVERKALYTDVDYVGHVNNVSYIKWIQDLLDPQLLEKADKMRFDINYLNEILCGENVELFSASITEENLFAFLGKKIESGQPSFRAELQLF